MGDDVPVNDPVIPDYGDANITGLAPGCLLASPGRRPEWFPEPAQNAETIVLVLVDGMGWNQLTARRSALSFLDSMSGRPITTVAPSTTASALTSLATGAAPIDHGIVGYRMDMGDGVMNSLRWSIGDRDVRRSHGPESVQPIPPFAGFSVPVVSRVDLESTPFTHAHLRGSRPHGWRTASSIVTQCARLVRAGERFVYAYYDGLDKIAHECGLGEHYDSEIAFVDWLLAAIFAALPAGTTLLVTADHGQVEVGDRVVELPTAAAASLSRQSGEGRFRWLHARAGRAGELHRICRDAFGDRAWVVSKEQVIDEGWLGRLHGNRDAAVRRLGDVALVPFAPISFHDPDDSGPFTLIGRHGSLTADEMLVPLLARTRE